MPTYSISAKSSCNEPRLIKAESQVVALHWLLDNDESFATTSGIGIVQISDLVDLTTRKTAPVPKRVGGYGWIERHSMLAYLESDEYKQSL